MQTILLFFIFLEVLVKPSLLQNIPSYVPLCKRNDPELSKCFINSVNAIRPYLMKGIPEMNIPQGEPLYYSNISTSVDAKNTKLSAEVWNQQARGLMNFELKSLNLDLEKVKCDISIFFPKVDLKGEYIYKGKLIMFDIDTSGYFEINTTDILVNAEFIGKYYTKEEKQFIEFNEAQMKLEVGNAQANLTNLINGNEESTAILNQALNENIHTFIDEISPVLEPIFSGFVQTYINAVFQLFPVDTLFPTE